MNIQLIRQLVNPPYSLKANCSSLLLVIILTIHSFSRPFKVHRHNYIDSLYIIYLIIIAALHHFSLIASSKSSRAAITNMTHALVLIASILGLLPLITIIVVYLIPCCKK